MKSLVSALILLSAGPALADATGTWKTEPGDTGGYLLVDVAPCGAELCGTIKSAYDNSGAAVSGYEHAGKKMLWGMKANGTDKWSKGKIWAPDRDKTYNSKMEVKGDVLKVSGCVAIICRSQNWTRVK